MESNSAISYSRVSTSKQQLGGLSLDEQKQRGIAYANNHNLNISNYISETKSGKKNHSIMKCKDAKSKHIIITDVSRFCRSLVVGLQRIQELVDAGKTIHFIGENMYIDRDIFANKSSLTYKQLVAALQDAEAESSRISIRTKNVKIYKRNRGEYMGGKTPFGLETYEVTYIDDDGVQKTVKKCRFNPHELNVIRFIEKCSSSKYTSSDLSNLMKKISKHQDPIELIHECKDKKDENFGYELIADVNTTPMKRADIAQLLNTYEVLYKNQQFTAAIIKRIRPISELESYIVVTPEDNFDLLIDKLSNLEVVEDDASPKKKRKRCVEWQVERRVDDCLQKEQTSTGHSQVERRSDRREGLREQPPVRRIEYDTQSQASYQARAPITRHNRLVRENNLDNESSDSPKDFNISDVKEYEEFKMFQKFLEFKKSM